MDITLRRTDYYPDCTLGIMTVGGFQAYSIERPWLNNKKAVSCIPKGVYKFVPHNWESSAKFKFAKVWRLLDVPNRTAILIHNGNTSKDVIGCIAVGSIRGSLGGKHAVLNSRETLDKLRAIIGEHGGTITIR